MKRRVRPLIILCAALVMGTAGAVTPSGAAAWGRGHFYVIGTGPAGPATATLEALETMQKMDAFMAPPDHVKLFSEYVAGRPVLFDPWTGIWDYEGKSMWKLDEADLARFKEERFRIREERVGLVKSLLAQGKDVGLLDSGNPCLYGPSHWYAEQFDPRDVVIIPGMGCDAAAMAALGKSTIPAYDTRFVIQTSPFSLMRWAGKDGQALKALSQFPFTMILYMALWKPQELFESLRRVLPGDTPCAVVFWAGYPDRERILRGTVGDMAEKLAKEKEKFMGLLLIGRFLEGKPYEAAMKMAQERLGKK